MKGFAFVLLCALVAVQGRSTAVQETSRAELGESPWTVHLRVAVATGGLLNTCAGSLIGNEWVLTAAECVTDLRFVWVRYGVVNVISPSLVTENGQAAVREYEKLALLHINRIVETTDAIAPVRLTPQVASESVTFCAFGAESDGSPGESLSCSIVGLAVAEDGSIVISSEDIAATKYDVGAAVVTNGVQLGVVTGAATEDNAGAVTLVDDYLAWIGEQTGLYVNSDSELKPEVAPEVVKVVN